jgi:UDP-glucose:(heptosyl)LPS alpha-1,3-glucosyltransferase
VYRAGDGVHAEWLAQRARIQSPLARLATRWSPHHRYLLAAERALFTSEKLKAVICNSDMVRGQIATRFSTDPSKLVVIRNSVDGTAFHPGLRAGMRDTVRQQLKIPASANVVVYVGSGFERKGVRLLLDAVSRVRPELWAIVVGKDKRSGRYVEQARALGIGDRVRFVGATSDVRPYYAAADSFALPTLYDPFPNAALEAMACGLPVVTSTMCGVAEVVREGETGFVRDALDVMGLSECLARLDPATAQRMGASARDAVATLTPSAMAGQFIDLYARLLRK